MLWTVSVTMFSEKNNNEEKYVPFLLTFLNVSYQSLSQKSPYIAELLCDSLYAFNPSLYGCVEGARAAAADVPAAESAIICSVLCVVEQHSRRHISTSKYSRFFKLYHRFQNCFGSPRT